MKNRETRYFLGLVIYRCCHSTIIVLVQDRPIRFGCSHQLGKQSRFRPVQRLHRPSPQILGKVSTMRSRRRCPSRGTVYDVRVGTEGCPASWKRFT
jgi:hypothetical protein